MPAEWTRHERCWMAWPCRLDFWGDNLLATQKVHAGIANAISAFEPVTMLTPPGDIANCRAQCSELVTVLPVELDDSWMRDNGPNFVLDEAGNLAASIFHFNAWGKKHGLGTLTGANGDKYVGNLKDSKPHGRGTYRWANGNKYVGEYTDGNAWQGTKYDGNGKVIATWIGGVETSK